MSAGHGSLNKPFFILKLLSDTRQKAMKASCFLTSSTFLCPFFYVGRAVVKVFNGIISHNNSLFLIGYKVHPDIQFLKTSFHKNLCYFLN